MSRLKQTTVFASIDCSSLHHGYPRCSMVPVCSQVVPSSDGFGSLVRLWTEGHGGDTTCDWLRAEPSRFRLALPAAEGLLRFLQSLVVSQPANPWLELVCY